ncbi:hypothetical protein [Streptomyces sp. AC512_CC834]|uniref:diaminopimelate decarboxylase family protein n=1 Tax=Streptomyces sp. AC512_CC834 TaxID=2823691 RepID=UPI001C26664C|nr:hypothetical protein [Streptomyces sp. AC512_CC834]
MVTQTALAASGSPAATGNDALYLMPPEGLLRAAERVGTPALIYDIDGVGHTLRRMREDLAAVPGVALNVALKSCHTLAVLRRMTQLGVGCDVASVGELDLARRAGFREITATGPAFSADDFQRMRSAGVVVDVDSASQLALYGAHFPGTDVGLRVRVPLPAPLESAATFGRDSRFGVAPTDPRTAELVARHGLRVTRLHTHTGQMTPESLLFKTAYLLLVAEHHRDVHTVDFGGGFFHLYENRPKLLLALRRMATMVTDWRRRTGRNIQLRFEPGGAVLAPYGYLVTEVRAVEDRHPVFGQRVVTVDCSAWNLAPWHRPQALPLYASDAPAEPVLIAGNTLYENDFFGLSVDGGRHPMRLPPPRVGDRVVLTAAGAYTMTNSRRFNRIEPPSEYLFDDGSLTAVTPAS